MSERSLTIVHVSHEAVEHIGGIGTVLEGLMTSPVYKGAVRRSILVAPLWRYGRVDEAAHRIGDDGVEVFYSGMDGVDRDGIGAKLKPIEWAFGVRIVFGRRRYANLNDDERSGEADVLLFDLRAPSHQRIDGFKDLLLERFGLNARRYEHDGDFQQWLHLAPPAYAALVALLAEEELPAVLISHEYMGMCTALLASLDQKKRFRTVFHAHECSTARGIVEGHTGHDSAFYPVMRAALARGQRVDRVFGDQSANPRHELISRVHHLDMTLAVGDETAEEMRFLSDEVAKSRIEVCYNGVPAARVDFDAKMKSRAMVDQWLEGVVGYRPDYLFTHVTRPVISKGLWRDLRVCAHIERDLKAQGKRAVSLLLTSGAATRTFEQVEEMRKRYGWPRAHHEGFPDVVGPEVGLWHDVRLFNNPGRAGSGAVEAILVNQFGFTRERIGGSAPEGIGIGDLRRAADVEFGQSIYEPFGIAQLEPLHAGAICVVSSVCGCRGFARRAISELGWKEAEIRNVLVADYTKGVTGDPIHMSQAERDAIEERVVEEIAPALLKRLSKNDDERLALLESGQAIAMRMGWDRVCEREFLPAIRSR